MSPRPNNRKRARTKYSPSLVIISGGQTGADRAALDWAIRTGVPHGGWCPKGRLAEDGQIPKRYQLRETKTSHYSERTEKNVQDSDGTVIITVSAALTAGCALTAKLAEKHSKPLLRLNQLSPEPGILLAEFVHQQKIARLNVAGSRSSKEASVARLVRSALNQAFSRH
jgi:Circularly permutated YpsA SLOG family